MNHLCHKVFQLLWHKPIRGFMTNTNMYEIPISRKTQALKTEAEKTARNFPFKGLPISYFGLHEQLTKYSKELQSENLGIDAQKDLEYVLKHFPGETDNYDLFVRDTEKNACSFLVKNGFDEFKLTDKADITSKNYGCVCESPYRYIKKKGCAPDIFLDRIGAVVLDEADVEHMEITNLYVGLQPGTIIKRRIHQSVPTFVFGRASGNLESEKCWNQCEKIYSRVFENRANYLSLGADDLSLAGGLYPWFMSYNESKFNGFKKTVEKEMNLLENTRDRWLKRVNDEDVKRYVREGFEIPLNALEKCMAKDVY